MVRERVEEIGVALALLTRLPLPRLPDHAFARQGQSGWAWPLAGLVVAGLALAIGLGLLRLGVPGGAAALVVVAVQMVLTGAMHEDGLADTADGLWGGFTPERRLEIMKDSRIGTYGVLALVVSVGLRWSICAALLESAPGAILALAALSRAGMPAMMALLPNARGGGLSHSVGAPGGAVALGAVAMGLAVGLAVVGPVAVLGALAVGVSGAGLGYLARRKIGGQTGDILGASQQAGEVVAGLALLAVL